MTSFLRQAALLLRMEGVRYLRNPQILLLAMLPPASMAVLVWALTLNVTQEPVALVVEDQSPSGERLLQILVSDTDAYRLMVTDAVQAEALLHAQRVAAIITIPGGFAGAAATGGGRVLLDLNNVDLDFSDDIRRSLDRSVGIFNGLPLERDDDDDAPGGAPVPSPIPEARKQVPRAGADPLPIPTSTPSVADGNPYLLEVEEHDRRQTDVSFLAYELVPVIISLVLNMAMIGTTVFGARDAATGVQRAWRTTPVAPLAAVIARIVMSSAIAISAAGVVILCCWMLPRGLGSIPHPALLVATLSLAAISAAVLGTLIGHLPFAPRALGLGAMVLSTILFLLGGAFCTVAMLPAWLRVLCALDPMHGAIDGLRQALFYPQPSGWADALLPLEALLVLGLAGLGLRTLWRVRRSR